MTRPGKMESDDRYNEESLNLQEAPRAGHSPETDDILPELGETDRHDRFDRLSDEDLFQNNRA